MSVSPLTTLAATPDTASLLPVSVDLMYQLDLSKITDISDFIIDMIAMDFSEDEISLTERVLTDNIFSIAVDMFDEESNAATDDINTTVSFKLTETDLEEVLDSLDENRTETKYKEHTIYDVTDGFGVYLEDLFLLTTSEENAKSIIDNFINDTTSLGKDALYMRASEHYLDNAFLNMYIDPKQVLSSMPMETSAFIEPFATTQEFTQDYLEALLSEAVSVAQTDSGFDFSVFIEGDTEKLTALNMLMNKFEFTPSLYKKLSGEGLMLYSESTDLKGAVDNILEMSTDESIYQMIYDETSSAFEDFFEQNLQTDLLDLLDGNHMLTVHNDGKVIPGFTMIFDASAHKTLAKANIALINEKLNSFFKDDEEASGLNYYSYGLTTLGEDKLPKHILDLKKAMEDTSSLTTADLRLNLTLGVTDDGMIVFSTHSDLGSLWQTASDSKGLLSNEGLADSFTNPQEVITQIMYLDIDSLTAYLEEMMIKTDAPEEPTDLMKGLLGPWHNLFATSKATENTATANGTLTVDIEKLNDYPALFESYDVYIEEQFRQSYLSYSMALGCDVGENDWFREPVLLLYYDGIVSGYDDGCFRPGNEITRAEFTKMVYSAAEMAGLTGATAMSDQDKYFTDVDSNAWYAHYINQAAASDLVNGYPDGTFHPNAPITRGEAVQILYNASKMIRDLTEERIANESDFSIPFTDVNLNSDWFGHAVAGMNIYHIVDGTATGDGNVTFSPARNINRAEAAKIIYKFFELHR